MRTFTTYAVVVPVAALATSALLAMPASAATASPTADAELDAAYNDGAVLVASGAGEHLVDSVSAGPLAAALTTSVLLAEPTQLGSASRSRLMEMSPDVVYIIGGTSAVPAQVETDIKTALPAVTVVRLQGNDRYATATSISVKVQDFYNWYFTQSAQQS